MKTADDLSICTKIIKEICTPEEIQAMDEMPHWDLMPPQRESYENPGDYAQGVKGYAQRVIRDRESKKYRD